MTLPRAVAHARGSSHSTSTSSGTTSRKRSRTAPPTATVPLGKCTNFGNCSTSPSRNMVAQRADAFDLDFHGVARLQRADSGWRAGEDDIARLERHHAGDELDDERAWENHHARASVLFDHTVDACDEREV